MRACVCVCECVRACVRACVTPNLRELKCVCPWFCGDMFQVFSTFVILSWTILVSKFWYIMFEHGINNLFLKYLHFQSKPLMNL